MMYLIHIGRHAIGKLAKGPIRRRPFWLLQIDSAQLAQRPLTLLLLLLLLLLQFLFLFLFLGQFPAATHVLRVDMLQLEAHP